ncbi:hypothetical protein FNH22_28495 [Fulvivirga sp. M361]|uniref:carboxypeptidase-like regulatory domain-containing protein n=1 Tax=Fulvivirga sp. M361 TaxID=2594266 RepID=UPI00117BA065|nr:carboxypeptidase-like regulatory domain-containing protein [Fulvivirga sp. M361]TRX48704.1 hypothetical protein FNH22_28495 [Fulvivirga sp. M361]
MPTNNCLFLLLALCFPKIVLSQAGTKAYTAGFTIHRLIDESRTYKPNTRADDSLHYRPVDLDIWYPSYKVTGQPLVFKDLFQLLEDRAVRYQDGEDYTGFTNEMAQFFVAELGIEGNSETLLNIKTETYADLGKSKEKHPLIIYMAGFNGMGFENYKVLEKLAQNGFVVVSIWSVGRYPGNMTNEMTDMMEQVYDAEFAMKYLRERPEFNIDFTKVGVLGCSWGGMSGGVLADRNPNISAMVSFDGTETTYFGEPGEAENDHFLKDIHDKNLLNPAAQTLKYMYLESGDKLDEYTPSASYNYFEKLNAEKYYLRYKDSKHVDFLCIPSILNVSENSVRTYSALSEATVLFFNKYFKDKSGFNEYFDYLITLDNTTDQIFNKKKPENSHMGISGIIIDSKSKAPLPYVNIGILNKEVGTVTDTSGEFILRLEDDMLKDTIRVSMIGYQPIVFVAGEKVGHNEYCQIELEEKIDELKEVVITAKAYKEKTLGNKTVSKFLSTGFGYNQLGAEMGIKVNIKKKPTYVDAFNFNISYNRLSAKSIFRLNFYTIKKGKPAYNVLKENILIPLEPKETGVKRIDLGKYNIILTEDVFVTLEWVDNEGQNDKGEAIYFSLALLSNGTIYKASSQSKYKKHSSLGVGFNIDVKY